MDSRLAVHLAVLAIVEDATTGDLSSANVTIERATEAGHRVVAQDLAASEAEIRAQLTRWIGQAHNDVIIVVGDDRGATKAALAPLVTEALPGFANVWVARCSSKLVFVLPPSPAAAKAAMDTIILPRLDTRRSDSLTRLIPRFSPTARGKPRTGKNVVKRDRDEDFDPPTKPIDVERLEQQIAMSSADNPTRQVDVARLTEMAARGEETENEELALRKPAGAPPKRPPPVAPPKPAIAIPPAGPPKARTPALGTPVVRPPPRPETPPAPPRRPPIQTPPMGAPIRPAAPALKPAAPPVPPVVKPVPRLPPKPPGADEAVVLVSRTPEPPKPPEAVVLVSRTPEAVTPTPPPPPPRSPVDAGWSQPLPKTPDEPPPAKWPTAEPSTIIKRLEPAPAIVDAPVSEAPPTPPPPPPRKPVATPVAGIPLASAPPPRVAVATPPVAPPVVAAPPPVAVATPEPPPEPPKPIVVAPPAPPPPRPRWEEPADFGAVPEVMSPRAARADKTVMVIRRGPNKGVIALLLVAAACAVIAAVVVVTHQGKTARPDAAIAIAHAPVPPPTPVETPDAAVEPEIDVEPPQDAGAAHPARPVTPATPPITPRTPPATPATPPITPRTPPTTPVTPPHAGSAGPATPPTTPVEPAHPLPPGPPPAAGCDEVSCVLDRYARPCCERYKPADTGFDPKKTMPDRLDRTMVKEGVERMKPRVIACGEKTPAKGTVKLSITVGPDGSVSDASVTEAPDPALGACVAGVLKRATFGKTINGATFVYPFVF